MRQLNEWQRALVVPASEFMSLADCQTRLGVSRIRVTTWISTKRLKEVYNAEHEVGAHRSSVMSLEEFRRTSGLIEKTWFALGTLMRMV